MKRLIELSLQYRILVLLATVFVAAIGFISLRNLPIDAEPDITPNQVLVLTRAPSLSPLEVEQLISFPVETAMRGLPGITRIQSTSKYGLSYVAFTSKTAWTRTSVEPSSVSAFHKQRSRFRQTWECRRWGLSRLA